MTPWHTYAVETISDASRTPLPLVSAPTSTASPPEGQWASPAASATVFTMLPAPLAPLHAYWTLVTSDVSRIPLPLVSAPLLIFTPPVAQLAPSASTVVVTSMEALDRVVTAVPLPPSLQALNIM